MPSLACSCCGGTTTCSCCCVGPDCCDQVFKLDIVDPPFCTTEFGQSGCSVPDGPRPCFPEFPGSPTRTEGCTIAPVGGDDSPCLETIDPSQIICICDADHICQASGNWFWKGRGFGPCPDTPPAGGCS